VWNFAYRKSSVFEEVKFTDWHLNNVYIRTRPYIGIKLQRSEGDITEVFLSTLLFGSRNQIARRELMIIMFVGRKCALYISNVIN